MASFPKNEDAVRDAISLSQAKEGGLGENSEYLEAKHGFSHTPRLTQKTSWYMIFLAIFVGMGGWIVNFDLGYSGIVLQMKSFNQSFGHCAIDPKTGLTECALTATQQSVNSIYVLFMAVGGGLSSITGSYFGRRTAIQLSCAVIAIGVAGQLGSAGNFPAYVSCKCTSVAEVISAEHASRALADDCRHRWRWVGTFDYEHPRIWH